MKIKLFLKLILTTFLLSNFSIFAKELKKVSIQLNWKYQFEYAGFIIAKEKGFYEKIGFDVKLKEFNNNTNTLKDIINNKSTFAISDSLLMIERQSNDIVLLANYYKQSPLVIVTNKTIKHPKDLEFKSLMSSQERLINTPIDFMFKHLTINYKNINFKKNTYNIQELIDNRIDAMEVYRTNELYRLVTENIPHNIIDPTNYGFNSGAVNMFTSRNNINKYGERSIQEFIDATNNGWKYAFENIDETINLIDAKYNKSLNKTKDALLFEANETKKLFLLNDFKIGDINKQELYRWSDILNNYGLIKNQKRYDKFIFNQEWKEKLYTKNEFNTFLITGIFTFLTFILLIVLYFSKAKAKVLKNKIDIEVQKNKEIQELSKIVEESENELKIINENLYATIKEKTKEQSTLLSLFDKGSSVLFKWNNDEHWSVDYVSLSIENLLGYTHNEFKNDKVFYANCIHKDDINKVIAEVKEGSQLTQSFFKHKPYRIITKDGEIKWVIDYTVVIKDNDNNITHYLGYINDITQEREKERLLFEQSKMASLGEMIGNIAHQWRQPLSVISTASTGIIMQKECDILTDESLIKSCESINDNAQYLSKTIDDFKNFIKGERTKTIFNLKDNLNSFLHLTEGSIKSNNIHMILDLEKDIKINGYENELIQCLINIFNNAKDILVEKEINYKLVFMSTDIIENKVIIKIKDNAGGIPEDVLPKIFEPYFTTKHHSQGTGLGLHMIYNLIVDGMNGIIEAKNKTYLYKSKEYTGAEFTISLPMDETIINSVSSHQM
ncbi:MAG: ABC transporter substrate-binding protein [Arcobacteraceae bacterium]|nr:ABC transporter substrate-binding protein [Arcobacteraceae bacterium]